MAADLATMILDFAWEVLGDRERRCGYDDYLGIRRTGEGWGAWRRCLPRPGSTPASLFTSPLENPGERGREARSAAQAASAAEGDCP
jgi:hypothetical protein